MTKIELKERLFKGPLTSCEYYDNERLLIGCGPYLSLIDDATHQELSRLLALKYRVIHKIVLNRINKLICVFGQKAFNIVKLNEAERPQFESVYGENYFELNDWIFDMNWLNSYASQDLSTHVAIVCAHNQAILYNLDDRVITKLVNCSQKCML